MVELQKEPEEEQRVGEEAQQCWVLVQEKLHEGQQHLQTMMNPLQAVTAAHALVEPEYSQTRAADILVVHYCSGSVHPGSGVLCHRRTV